MDKPLVFLFGVFLGTAAAVLSVDFGMKNPGPPTLPRVQPSLSRVA